MHPPAHILKKLQELHPQARLGWWAESAPGCPPDMTDDTDNRGHFCLLQLYHVRDFERTYLAAWDEAGPVYGKDYDRMSRVPVRLATFTKAQVFSGDILDSVKEMLRPFKERFETSARAKGAAEASRVKDMAGEAGEYLWHRKNKKDNANNVAAKFEKPVEITRSSDDLKEAYLPKEQPYTFGKIT
jgi:hypothetical protein